MKRFLVFLFASVFSVGCVSSEPIDTGSGSTNGAGLVITASCAPLTRTDIDEGKSTWEAGDRITVVYDGRAYEYTAAEAGAIATFTSTDGIEVYDAAKSLVAYYPATSVDAVVSLPAVQEIEFDAAQTNAARAPLIGVPVLAAETAADGKLSVAFRNIFSVIELRIDAGQLAGRAVSLTVEPADAADFDGFLSFTGTVDPATLALTPIANGTGNSLKLVFADGIDPTLPQTIKFPVGRFSTRSGLELTLTMDDGSSYSKTIYKTGITSYAETAGGFAAKHMAKALYAFAPAATELCTSTNSLAFGALPRTQIFELQSPLADWTVEYDAEWLKLNLSASATASVKSGAKTSTVQNIYVTPEINTTGAVRNGKLLFKDGNTTVEVAVTQSADLSEVAAGAKGFPAVWRFRDIVSSGGPWQTTLTDHFVEDNYVTTSNGSAALLSFVRAGENSFVNYHRRTINASNYYPVLPGTCTGDYWLFSIPVESLPAGSAVDVFLPIGSLKNAPKYFVIEYFDNGEWKSVEEDLRTAVEDASVKYTAFLTGNSNYARWFSQTVRFTQAFSHESLLVRCRAVGKWTADKGLYAASTGMLDPASSASSNINISLTDGQGPVIRNYGMAAEPSTVKKVLIIGNSFTFWNGSPTILKELAYTDGSLYIKPYVLTRGSQTLGNWLVNDNSGGLGEDIISWGGIDLGGYDYAIIQDQSQNPAKFAQEGSVSISDECKALVDRIHASSPACQVLLEQTWAYSASSYGGYTDYATFDELLWKGTVAMAEAAGTWVSPIGLAFRYVRENYSSIKLLAYEDKHPSYAGSYLKSCVNCLMMTGKKFGETVSDGLLDAQTAAALRTAAEKVVLEDFYGKASFYKR